MLTRSMRLLTLLPLLALPACEAALGPSTADIRAAVKALYNIPPGTENWPLAGPADLRDAKIIGSSPCTSAGAMYFCDTVFERADGSRVTMVVDLVLRRGAGWRANLIYQGPSPGPGD
jgi:hypothetical protein